MISLELFRDSNARKLFMGQLLSQIGDKMMSLGLVWIIASHASMATVPWFLAAGSLPHLLLAPFSARWIARLGPLRTVIATDIVRGLIYLSAAAIWLSCKEGSENAAFELPALFAITLLANCASAAFNPAIMSLPMTLKLPKSELLGPLTALIDSCFSLGNVLGPLVAVLAYPWLHLEGLFLLNAASYFWAALLEARICTNQPSTEAQDPTDLVERRSSWAILRSDRLLAFLMAAFFLMNITLTPLLAFLPLFAREHFHGKLGALATMEMAIGLGSIIGSLGLTLLRSSLSIGQRSILGLLAASINYILFSLSGHLTLSCAALFLIGLSLAVVNVSMITLFQTRPRAADVAQVMTLVNFISVGAVPFSMTLSGGLLEHVPLNTLATLLAIALLVLSTGVAANREFRRL